MTTRRIHTVDVFTAVPFLGNPVAVILDGEGLTTAQMQTIANWTNLSETTFVTLADGGADYHLRIFTPRTELPFAGHPTIGSAHALLAAGLIAPHQGIVTQHCAVGAVEIAVPDDWRTAGLSFRLPAHQISPAPDPAALTAALGATPLALPAIVNVGPRWVIAQLADEATVRGLTPDYAALAAYDTAHRTTGLTLFSANPDGGVTVRSFAPADGINEDPVCGSGNGAVAAYRLEQGQAGAGDSYTASQGREVARDGTVRIAYAAGSDATAIHVGGRAVTVVEGLLSGF